MGMRHGIYDSGMYVRFFLYGPGYSKDIMSLNQDESFAAIQTRLFVKYCGKLEIQKATGVEPRKQFSELIILKSFCNQIHDIVMHLRNVKTIMSGGGRSAVDEHGYYQH